MPRLGVVGSRRRASSADRLYVFAVIQSALKLYTKNSIVIVSGGCRTGADAFAAEAVRCFLSPEQLVEHLPNIRPGQPYGDMVSAYYARNRLIAQDVDIVFALTANDRKGGTENTIKHAREFGKPVMLCLPDGSWRLES